MTRKKHREVVFDSLIASIDYILFDEENELEVQNLKELRSDIRSAIENSYDRYVERKKIAIRKKSYESVVWFYMWSVHNSGYDYDDQEFATLTATVYDILSRARAS